MAKENILSRASAIGTIVGVPGSLVSFYQTAPSVLTYSFTGLAIISLTFWSIYSKKSLVKYLPSKFKTPSNIYRNNFETIAHTTDIKITTPNAKTVEYCCTTTIKSLCHSANEYYCRVAPTDKYSNIRVYPGVISSKKDAAGGWDIFIKLDTPCRKGETREIKIMADICDIFPNNTDEFWEVQKYYRGDCSYKIKITFHPSKPPITAESKIIIQEDRNNAQNTKSLVKKDVVSGCAVLIAESDELKVSEVLYLGWTW